jgi:hypothetical protein
MASAAGRGAISRDEQLAMRTFEAAVALRLAGNELSGEALLAVRADDFLRALLGGDLGHSSTVPPCHPSRQEEAVALQRRALGRRRLGTRVPQVNQTEKAFAVRQTHGVPPGLRT